MSSRSQEIDNQAAEWIAKRNLRELTAEEQAEFDAWLAADPRHLGAAGRAEAVLARLDRVSGAALGEAQAQHEAEALPVARRRFVMAGGIAASIAAVGITAAALWPDKQQGGSVVAAGASFATSKGQTREILLTDRSIITLNTNSRVSVELTKDVRKVWLEKGEALFDVAKDKQRPFIVYAGDTQVRAVGTSFTVCMLPQRPLQVLVREGVVELKRADTASVLVGASTRALAPRDTPFVAESVSSAKLARDLAWQYGRISLDNQTLQDAADEFARYSDMRIVVDPTVASRTVTGLFASNDPVGFAKAAASVLKLRVRVNDAEVHIYERTEEQGVGKS